MLKIKWHWEGSDEAGFTVFQEGNQGPWFGPRKTTG